MRILITGNLGYVGPVTIRRLRQSFPDAELLGFDTGYFAHCLTGVEALPDCCLDAQFFGDVRDLPDALLHGIDGIVHLAAISNDPMGNTFEAVTLDINHRGSVRLAERAKACGVQSFVFASSCSVYGCAEQGARNEASEVNPLTAYARSKVLTERDLEQLATSSFKVTCLRFATACGMSDRLRLDLVLNDFVASAMAFRKIEILSDGTPWRPLINVKDMARAIEWALTRDVNTGGACVAVNVGSEQWNYQIKELAEAVKSVIADVEVSINKNAVPDKRSYKVDFSMFRKLAPFHQPELDLRTTVLELQEGLERMRFAEKDFRSSALMRLNVLSDLRKKGLLTESLRWSDRAGHASGRGTVRAAIRTGVPAPL
ncbi:MAG: SDR family oxidoreductase [Acidobacteria bacterium]|nr:SDR family oxidoreductase [Acidobacteriota bacterium]